MNTTTVFLVFGVHNRHGEWLAAAYDNEAAAESHKKYLDATQDGWENFSGGSVQRVEIARDFHPAPKERAEQPQ